LASNIFWSQISKLQSAILIAHHLAGFHGTMSITLV
jgi:hypothetical protein